MRHFIISAIAITLLAGCGSKAYYEEQPYRDDAETERVTAIGEGLGKVVKAWRQEKSGRADQRAVKVPVPKKRPQQAPCTDCGGAFMEQFPPTEAVVHLAEDSAGNINPTAIEFKDAALARICPQDDPCFEGAGGAYSQAGIEAPVQGTGQAISSYNIPAEPDQGVQIRTAGQSQQTAESLLLQYLLMERQAAALLAAEQERTKQKQEETRQFKKIMEAYQAAVLKDQPQQAAPYNPESNINAGLDNIPFVSAILGMYNLGKQGIQGARGDTTANMNNGSSLAQEGAGSSGVNPISTIKNTTYAAE